MTIIKKWFTATFKRIDLLCAPQSLILNVDHYLLNGQTVAISKAKDGFSAHIDFKPQRPFSSSQIHSIELPQPIMLKNSEIHYFIPENAILLNQQYFDHSCDDEVVIHINGSISQITTAKEENWNGKFLRLILPINNGTPKMKEIRGCAFDMDIKAKERRLIKTVINDIEYHFYTFMLDAIQFLIIDSTKESYLDVFTKTSHAILLGLGFLYGDLFMDEGYIVSATVADFAQITDIRFVTYRESILTGYRIHTTNAYSILNLTGRTDQEIENRLIEAQAWINDLVEIEPEVFNKLCELFLNNEPISRSAIITLQGNIMSLEVKGSAYSIALEALTSVVLEEKKEKSPKPASKIDFKKLKDSFNKVLDEIFPAIDENKTLRQIFTDRFSNLNSPTNTSKLRKAFELVGYELNGYEIEAINARNKFQHGLLPISESTEDSAFQQVYFVCIVMHRLLYLLILKQVGYSGYIINYPQLHSNITKRDLGEKVFYHV